MEKKYYWIKLKQSLMTSDKVDYLMSQKDGANYVVLYQCLCLLTTNTKGVLGKEIGEIIIPYDVDKIQRDTKWFTKDTILVALELYKKLGLIYQLDNGLYQIKDYEELVGSETSSAKRVRDYRKRQSLQCNTDVTQEIDIDNRDRFKDIDKDKDIDLDIDFINKHISKDDDADLGTARIPLSIVTNLINTNKLFDLKPCDAYLLANDDESIKNGQDIKNFLIKLNEERRHRC